MARSAIAFGAVAMLACASGCAAMQGVAGPGAGATRAAPAEPKPLDATAAAALNDSEIERRLAFLASRLDANRSHAKWWSYGFLAVNGGGMAAEAATAATESGSDRDYAIIESGKALIGTVYLLAAPLPGRRGADPIREMPSATHAERAAQLAEAEAILYGAKHRADQRTGWALHVGNVGINAAGASALMAEGSYGKAALSFFLDAAVGEAEILLTPWQPATDWREYQAFVQRGGGPAEPTARWHLRPSGRGLALEVDF